MIHNLDHIGIAVRSLETRLPFWAEALGLEVAGIETVDAEKVKIAFLPAGAARVELLEPTDDSSPIARFLEKRGEGIHHLTFAVSDIDGLLERLRERNVAILGDGARTGAGGSRVAFLHPRAAGGVLVELVEQASPEPADRHQIVSGSAVLVYLRDPQEKMWGVLGKLDTAGVLLEGIDLNSFDDWISQIEREEESVVGPSVVFVPMVRVEKILLDRPSGHLPSLAERFERRTGRSVQSILSAAR